ncbi:ABC transporter permease [Agromyces archimandritae]|uniref:ABC transporter permease n=1 Tax=Agromyces archimandritae TaxID=2781962 RepID=A0A975FL61_9MICO|nr:ABC transporter permease [Agromyces archimandritae]QTX03463.1 ABC transporter permease [Agromyces archimandritae]
MLRRILVSLGQFAITVLVATMIVFLLLRVMPGDPAVVALGINATPDALDAWRHEHGTDRPLWLQYLEWMGGLVTGDFGTSYVTSQELTPLIADRVQVTLILVGCAMLLALVIAVPIGTLAAVRHRDAAGAVLSGASQIGVAIPNFLVGVLLIAFFSVRLGWFPSGGWVAPAEDVGAFLQRLVLPVIALGSVQAAIITRYVRSAVLEIMREDFLRTGRAKGLTFGGALVRHGLRNAGVPVITIVGVQLAALLIGAVVIERVFAIPGLGSLLVDSVANRDLLAVQAVVVVLVLLVVLLNLIVDVVYALVDPRLRREAA